MTRRSLVTETNTFVGGLITEVSPLTFPPNTAADILNFNINKDGTISRRLGVDYEEGYTVVDSGVSLDSAGEVPFNVFDWDNAGGNADVKIKVVQVGNKLDFFSTSGSTISGELLHSHQFIDNTKVNYSSSVVDGILVVASGSRKLTSFTYDDGVITAGEYQLKIRDLFGVADFIGGADYRDTSNVNFRPFARNLTNNHIYNLRNSTYSQLRLYGNRESLSDPIKAFEDESVNGAFYDIPRSPSNADNVIQALFADANDSDDRIAERFFPDKLMKSPPGNFESPKGYFIIDAMDRGASRLEEASNLVAGISGYDYFVQDLPADRTPGGASVVGEFGGRIWYGGFSGEVEGGDEYSPNLSSYLMFSRLVENPTDLGKCYQDGDPTSTTSPDLVATDGGFVRLDGAYGILKMINIGASLIVVASNGVWAVSGGNDYGFSALDYRVDKISNHGGLSATSIVQVDNSVLYWSDAGIYQIGVSELGDLGDTNISNNTIQRFYEDISDLDKEYAQGTFDRYERKVRWVYGNRLNSSEGVSELILDVNLGAFYPHKYGSTGGVFPILVAPLEVPPFKIGEVDSFIVNDSNPVVYNGESLVFKEALKLQGLREIAYLTITETVPTIKYTISKLRDRDFLDWKSSNSLGVDAPAHLITGYDGAGDFQRYKQVPSITFHFHRTEDGFEADELGDLFPTNPSSCKVQAQWDWANSSNSGRWGKEFQAYRYRRFYMPQDEQDPYDTGFAVISTKNRLRGKGRVLSLLIKTEAGKDCRLLGWSHIKSVAENV